MKIHTIIFLSLTFISQPLFGLTIFNNYDHRVTVKLLRINKDRSQSLLLEVDIKSGKTVHVKTSIQASDDIVAEISCTNWITAKPTNGSMFFMRASANPKGIYTFDLSEFCYSANGCSSQWARYMMTNEFGLLLQKEKGRSPSLEVIRPEKLIDPAFKAQLESAMNQKLTWFDKLRGKKRNCITVPFDFTDWVK
jgi:hypothetical protein